MDKSKFSKKMVKLLGTEIMLIFEFLDNQKLNRLSGFRKFKAIRPAIIKLSKIRLRGGSDGIPPMGT